MSSTLPDTLRPTLEAGLHQLGLDPALGEPLLAYLALLVRWNGTYNLTAIRDPRDMVVRHLLDSLAIDPWFREVSRLADLGTGPGLPGIPLAIANPRLQVALVESNGKKARFLREAVRRLQLDNVQVVESRIEAAGPSGSFDAITARALATLPDILAAGAHLLRPGGRLLAMKGVYPADELRALPEPWRLLQAHRIEVPGLAAERHLIVVGQDDRSASDTTPGG